MADKKEMIPQQYDLDAKWDACLDLTVRRFVYSSFAGAFGGLLFFSTKMLYGFLYFGISGLLGTGRFFRMKSFIKKEFWKGLYSQHGNGSKKD